MVARQILTSVPLLAGLILCGCATPPPLPLAAPVVPGAFKEAAPVQGGPRSEPIPDTWWVVFQDPQLDELQQRLVIGNENLKAAVAAVTSARASFDASRAVLWPTLSVAGDRVRAQSPLPSSAPQAAKPATSVGLVASANWEVDLWGRLAQASAGAAATHEASAEDLAAARLSAQAQLVQTYFSIRIADAQAALLDRSLAAFSRALELTQVRYSGGVASRTDVLQAEAQLLSVRAQRADTLAQRALLEHAIAVLLGVPPSNFRLEPSIVVPASVTVPVQLPADLMKRRPDIIAAQRRLKASMAQIGVADAAYFPQLTLSATAGFRNNALADLISAPTRLWSLGPSLVEAIFDGGQRALASAQARASADQAAANYRQVVLVAFQEVEDNLVQSERLAEELRWQEQALDASQKTLDAVMEQYRAGVVGYLNVVTAQSTSLNSEITLLSVRSRLLIAQSQLLKNLAGRWQGT